MKTEWASVTFGDLFEITSSKRVFEHEWKTSGVPFFRAREIVKLANHGSVDNDLFISEEHFGELESRFGAPKPGDIMVSAVGTLGACYVVQPNDRFYFKDASVIQLRPKKKSRVFPGFIQHAFRTTSLLDQVQSGSGSTVGTFTISRAKETRIDLPPYEEQKRIAAILDKADAIRRKRQQVLRLTDDFLRSVFLDMFGDPLTNPKGWDEVEFGELVDSTKLGMVRSSSEFGWGMPVPYVRMDALTNDGAFLPEKVQGTEATKAEIQGYGLEPGDFLFNTRNSKELVGKVAVYPGPAGATFNNNLMRIRFKKSADPYFVCQQFQFARVQRELEARKQGTTSVFAVYWKNLQTLPVLTPPPTLQKEFRAIVDKINSARTQMTREETKAGDLFASLQQRAFRGEL